MSSLPIIASVGIRTLASSDTLGLYRLATLWLSADQEQPRTFVCQPFRCHPTHAVRRTRDDNVPPCRIRLDSAAKVVCVGWLCHSLCSLGSGCYSTLVVDHPYSQLAHAAPWRSSVVSP